MINVGGSFGLSENQKDEICMLENTYKSLKKGGVLVMELIGKELMARTFAVESQQSVVTGCPD